MQDDELFSKGFTLLEFLVVVLIIAILVSLSVPSYVKAIEKTRAAEAISLLRAVYHSQLIYYMNHGKYASSLDVLTPQIKGVTVTAKKDFWSDYNNSSKKVGIWSVELEGGKNASISVGRTKGHFAGTGFFLQLQRLDGVTFPLDTIYCVEKTSHGAAYKQRAGSYCEDIMDGTLIHSSVYKKYKLDF